MRIKPGFHWYTSCVAPQRGVFYQMTSDQIYTKTGSTAAAVLFSSPSRASALSILHFDVLSSWQFVRVDFRASTPA